jgi:hypothetical protein
MKKLIYILLVIVCASPALFSQDYEGFFKVFMFGLAELYNEVETISMPAFVIRPDPEDQPQAKYLLDFKTPEDKRTFIRIMDKEEIPYVTFPANELRVQLFFNDMAAFMVLNFSRHL